MDISDLNELSLAVGEAFLVVIFDGFGWSVVKRCVIGFMWSNGLFLLDEFKRL